MTVFPKLNTPAEIFSFLFGSLRNLKKKKKKSLAYTVLTRSLFVTKDTLFWYKIFQIYDGLSEFYDEKMNFIIVLFYKKDIFL